MRASSSPATARSRRRRQLGWTHVAAAKSGLVGVDRTAYAIADNRIAELSHWDEQALRATADAMPPDALEAAGFSGRELDLLIGSGSPAPTEEVPAPDPLDTAVSCAGDLWELGDHRLLCGD